MRTIASWPVRSTDERDRRLPAADPAQELRTVTFAQPVAVTVARPAPAEWAASKQPGHKLTLGRQSVAAWPIREDGERHTGNVT